VVLAKRGARSLILPLFVALAAGQAAGAETVRAGEAPRKALELTWVAPPACPGSDAVRTEVLALARIERESSARLRANGVVRRGDRAWHLELTTEFDGMSGERALSATSCRALTDAAILTLALILNPDVERHASEPPRAGPGREQNSARLQVALSGRAGLQVGVLEQLGPEFALGAGLSLGSASLWAYAGFAPPQDARVTGSSGPGGRVWAGSASLLGCWDFTTDTPFGPCAGADFTRVEGEGISVANPQHAVTYWASGQLGLRAGVRLGAGVTLRVGGFAVLPAQRPSLFVEGVGRVLRPEPIGGKLQAGADFQLR
jgi:hypothetical protein